MRLTVIPALNIHPRPRTKQCDDTVTRLFLARRRHDLTFFYEEQQPPAPRLVTNSARDLA